MRLNAPVQWLEDNIERYVNRLAVPAGVPMAFPAPTKSIPFPKLRNFNRGNKVKAHYQRAYMFCQGLCSRFQHVLVRPCSCTTSLTLRRSVRCSCRFVLFLTSGSPVIFPAWCFLSDGSRFSTCLAFSCCGCFTTSLTLNLMVRAVVPMFLTCLNRRRFRSPRIVRGRLRANPVRGGAMSSKRALCHAGEGCLTQDVVGGRAALQYDARALCSRQCSSTVQRARG